MDQHKQTICVGVNMGKRNPQLLMEMSTVSTSSENFDTFLKITFNSHMTKQFNYLISTTKTYKDNFKLRTGLPN